MIALGSPVAVGDCNSELMDRIATDLDDDIFDIMPIHRLLFYMLDSYGTLGVYIKDAIYEPR